MAGPKIPSVTRSAGMSTPIQPRLEEIIGSQTASENPKVTMTKAIIRRNITPVPVSGESSISVRSDLRHLGCAR